MKNIFTFLIVIFLSFTIKAQEATLEETTDFLKEKIELFSPILGSKVSVNVNKCVLKIYDINDIDTTAYTYINLGEINDTIYYSKKEVLGFTTITIKGPGVYTISYGDRLDIENKGAVILNFKTKNIDRIEFSNSLDKALMNAKKLCKNKF